MEVWWILMIHSDSCDYFGEEHLSVESIYMNPQVSESPQVSRVGLKRCKSWDFEWRTISKMDHSVRWYTYIYGPHLYCRHLVNRDGVFHSKSLISILPCENLIDKLLTCFCFLWSPLSKTNGPSPSGRGTKFDRAVILNDVGGRRMSNPLESACGLALFCPWFPSHGSMDQGLADAQELWPSDLAMLICWEPTAGSWCYVSPSCNPPAHGTKSRCAGSRWKWAEKNHPNIGYSIPLLVMSTRFDLFVSLLRRTFGRTTLFRDAFPTRRTS